MRLPARIARVMAERQQAPPATEHQAFIRALPCAACGKAPPSECASVGFHRGLGPPTGEEYLVPLCGPETVWEDCCHSRKHFQGADRFWAGLAGGLVFGLGVGLGKTRWTRAQAAGPLRGPAGV